MPIGFILYYWRAPARQRASLDFHQQIVAALQVARQNQRLTDVA